MFTLKTASINAEVLLLHYLAPIRDSASCVLVGGHPAISLRALDSSSIVRAVELSGGAPHHLISANYSHPLIGATGKVQ